MEYSHLTPDLEHKALVQQFGGIPEIESVLLEYVNPRFFMSRQSSYRTERRGEVVFVVQRPSGCYVVTRMKEYPEGIYRLPSGGISYGEEVVPALGREIQEELGLRTEVEAFLGTIKYDIRCGANSIPFASYVFLLKEIGGRILEDAEDDEVSEYCEVDADGLMPIAGKLRSINDSWRDWGNFRAVAVEFAARIIKLRG